MSNQWQMELILKQMMRWLVKSNMMSMTNKKILVNMMRNKVILRKQMNKSTRVLIVQHLITLTMKKQGLMSMISSKWFHNRMKKRILYIDMLIKKWQQKRKVKKKFQNHKLVMTAMPMLSLRIILMNSLMRPLTKTNIPIKNNMLKMTKKLLKMQFLNKKVLKRRELMRRKQMKTQKMMVLSQKSQLKKKESIGLLSQPMTT